MENLFFEVIFLEDALEFLKSLEEKHAEKILDNIRKAQLELDQELFKKITKEIWEFRTQYQGFQYRLLSYGISRKGMPEWSWLFMDL